MAVDVMQMIADGLSSLTILSCLFLKVPQIVYMKEKQSAEGIYVQALLMEISGFTIMTLYNYTNKYALMTYMEYPIILVQVYIMMYFVLKFKGLLSSKLVPVLSIFYFGLLFLFIYEIIPKHILSYLVPLCTPLSGFAKVTYIIGIVQAGNADAVSLTTWMISVFTNSARVFTVYMDSADRKLVFNFMVSTLLSSGVLLTAVSYQVRGKAAEVAPPPPHSRRRSSLRRSKQD